jgi:multiple sugar transport system permease protein
VKSSQRTALWFLLPSFCLVALFSLFPIVESLRLSFYRMVLTLPWLGQRMVGWENYADLATDPVARDALMTTLLFIGVTIPLELLLGLGIALVLNEAFCGRGLLRAVVLIPWAIPTVVASQMWRFIFNDRYGLANFVLFGADTSSYLAPLADPHLALAAIMIAEIWKTTPFAALILLAGLQSIPDELYEAASVDGATFWQEFRHVTLPLLKPAVLLALLFRTGDSLRVFDLVYVMTQGGPADATNVLQFYGYKKTFAEGMIGYGSAIAVTVFLLSLTLALVYLHMFRTSRWKEAGL